MRLWLKSCPRCRGDVFEEHALSSVDLVCIQCGHLFTAAQQMALWFSGTKTAGPATKSTKTTAAA